MSNSKKVVRMGQRNFINSWLSPCSLRSHRTANPTLKNGFAIFKLCPPTTQIHALSASGGHRSEKRQKQQPTLWKFCIILHTKNRQI